MKATLDISDLTMRELEQRAAQQGQTVSELMEVAIRSLLHPRQSATMDMPPLPELQSGGARVDVANREALYDVLEHGACL
jgi:hypothetical protein